MHELYEAVIWPKNDGRSPVPEENPAAETDANLQVAFWLTGISPMVWRRVSSANEFHAL
jgi:hypothetical protein